MTGCLPPQVEFAAPPWRASEPSVERYWKLVGLPRGWETPSPLAAAHCWLAQALRRQAQAGGR